MCNKDTAALFRKQRRKEDELIIARQQANERQLILDNERVERQRVAERERQREEVRRRITQGNSEAIERHLRRLERRNCCIL